MIVIKHMAKKILIIDDDSGFVATISDRLKFEGYNVSIASDGDEGLDAIEHESPDLVVLDILMPKLNGYAFLKMLRSRYPNDKIAIIVCTARDDVMDSFKSEGIAGFLVKPFAPVELVTMVNVAFQLQKPPLRVARSLKTGTLGGQVQHKPEEPRSDLAKVLEKKQDQLTTPEMEIKPSQGPTEIMTSLSTMNGSDVKELPEKYKILIVDDEEDFVEALKERLKFEGFEVMEAFNGQDGLDFTRKERPHLILLDVMMPKIDGYMVCRLLKFDEKYQNIPIIMLTARSLDDDRDIGLSSGADEYITKPLDFSLLLRKIRQFLFMSLPEATN